MSTETERNPAPTPSRVFQRLDLVSPAPYPRSWYPRKLAWMFVQSTLFRWSPRPLLGWRRFLLRLFGAKLANTAVVRPSATIWHPWLFEMGAHSCLADDVTVYNLGPITIGDHSVVSQHAYLCAGTHDYTRPELPLQRPHIRIGSGVWVCAKAFIGPGVTIEDNAVVGAAAVVNRDVPAGMIVAGNPAKVVKPRKMGDAHADNMPLPGHSGGSAAAPRNPG